MEIITDLFTDLFYSSDLMTKFSAGLVIVCAGVLIPLILYLLFDLINTFGVEGSKKAKVVVVGKETLPAHSTTFFVPSGKVFVPISVDRNESNEIKVKLCGENVTFSVDKEFFDSISVGEEIEVNYGIERLTGKCLPFHTKKLRPEPVWAKK